MGRNATFRYEDELCAALLRTLGGLVGRQGDRLSRPVVLERRPVGLVIPDFLCIQQKRSHSSLRTSPISGLDAIVLDALARSDSHTAESLARHFYSSPNRIHQRLERLSARGLIGRTNAGSYFLPSKIGHNTASVVAVEAKLVRWRDALEQALSYLSFSDESYVALPSELIARNSDIRRRLASTPIGLIGVGASRSVLLRKAKKAVPHTPQRYWLLARTAGLPIVRQAN